MTTFIYMGLKKQEKVFVILKSDNIKSLCNYISDTNSDIESYIEKKQLILLTHRDTYLKHKIFDPDKIINNLKKEIEQDLAQGYSALWIAVDMSWILQGADGLQKHIEYEAKLNNIFVQNRCLTICHYNRQSFAPQILKYVLRTHTLALIGNQLYKNFYYIPPQEMLKPDYESLELEHWIQHLDKYKRTETELIKIARFSAENPNPVLRVSRRNIVLYANEASKALLDFWHCQEGKKLPKNICLITNGVLKSGQCKEIEVVFADRIFALTLAPIIEEKYINIYGLDITIRKHTAEQLKATLKEKEMLFRELYHRTKNNMQVINSILALQASKVDDKKIKRIFSETQNRIQTMVLVHQKLCQSHNLSRIDLKEYITELAIIILNSYNMPSDKISLIFEIEEVPVVIDIVIPCGLILNELLSNALKHAFPGNKKGTIQIILNHSENGDIELYVFDNGIGIPADFDFRTQNSLGMQIIHSIVEHQLQGKIDFRNSNGLSCHIRFNTKIYAPRI